MLIPIQQPSLTYQLAEKDTLHVRAFNLTVFAYPEKRSTACQPLREVQRWTRVDFDLLVIWTFTELPKESHATFLRPFLILKRPNPGDKKITTYCRWPDHSDDQFDSLAPMYWCLTRPETLDQEGPPPLPCVLHGKGENPHQPLEAATLPSSDR